MPPKRLNRKTKSYGEEENRTNLQRFTADSTNLLLTLNSLGLSYNNVYANIPDLLNPYNQLTLLMNQNMNVSQVQQFYNQIFNQSLSFNNNQPNNNIFNQWNQHRLSNYNVQGESYNCNDNLYFSNSYQSSQESLLSPNLFRPQRTSSRRIVPSWAFNNRTFYDLREYNAFSKAYDQAKLALRLMPKYEELNYLNSPFPDITSPYAPLNCFNYAVPRKIELLKQRTTMSSEEYERMRQDFNANGIHVDWTPSEIAERKDSTLLSVNILKDSYFPPLEPPSESKIHEIWKVDSKVQPMLPANTNPSLNSSGDGQVSTCARIKLYKPNKKSLEDHCVFCKNNRCEESVYNSHTVKDSYGRTICPRLRLYKCPTCGASGDSAHTMHYCPKKKIVTMEELAETTKTPRQSMKKAFQFRAT